MTDPRRESKSRLSLGVAGALGPAAIARIAAHAESAGFHALWVNDTPGGDALAGLVAAAESTSSLVLATGVLPLDRRSPSDIAAAASDLPAARTTLGVGSGGTRSGAIALVRDGVAQLSTSTDTTIMVGALGPRMRRLAATASAGPLLSWLTPTVAAAQAEAARDASVDVRVALYVRTALAGEATDRLNAEADRYASYPAYSANFARLGVSARDTILRPDAPASALAGFLDAVDEVVLRAITPHDEVEDYVAFIDDAAERFSLRLS